MNNLELLTYDELEEVFNHVAAVTEIFENHASVHDLLDKNATYALLVHLSYQTMVEMRKHLVGD